MRAPRRKRPRRRQLIKHVEPDVLAGLAQKATYIGSPEHKDTPSFSGQPKARADASLCDKKLAWEKDRVEQWLKTALLQGSIGEPWEGDFPRYVWHQEGDVVYEGRLVNKTQGQYKGYPLNSDEWPMGWSNA